MHPILLFAVLLPLVLCGCAMTGGKAHDIQTKELTYTAGGARCTGFVAWDAAIEGKRPGVLVVHEWWGHNDYVRRRARMLAELGYTALALDMYGDGKQASHPQDAQKFMNEVLQNMEAGKARFVAARQQLEQQPTTDKDHIAAIGYCFGGAVVLAMARSGMDLDAVASFHGNLATNSPAQKGQVKARVLVCHGADDQFIPPEQVAAFQKEMAAAGVDLEFHAYPGAVHGFTAKEATEKGKQFNLPLAYDADADRQSWDELKDFLRASFR
ncbi:MAG: dienelactone hydrolase family protein [Planctomycetota bacterium]